MTFGSGSLIAGPPKFMMTPVPGSTQRAPNHNFPCVSVAAANIPFLSAVLRWQVWPLSPAIPTEVLKAAARLIQSSIPSSARTLPSSVPKR